MSINGGGHYKAPDAFRTISEASEEVGVAPHVLRFWEGKFPLLKPLKRGGGRRFYRAQDMAILRGLKVLLQDEGYTIKGVQKLIKDNGIQSIRERGILPGSSETELHVYDHEDEIQEENIVQPETIKQSPQNISSKPAENSNRAIGLALRQTLIKLETARHILDKALATK